MASTGLINVRVKEFENQLNEAASDTTSCPIWSDLTSF